MTPAVGIRRATRADLPGIERLQLACNPVPWGARLLDATLTGPRSLAFVSEGGDTIEAYLIAQRLADIWHLLDVGVAPQRRRAGLGGALLRRLLGTAAGDGSTGVTLEVRVSNAGAIALYERLGFVDQGRRPTYYSDNGEDALIMTWSPEADAA